MEERTLKRQATGHARAPARRNSWPAMELCEVYNTPGDPALPPQMENCMRPRLLTKPSTCRNPGLSDNVRKP